MALYKSVKILDHGYVRLIECWGHGDAGVQLMRDSVTPDMECGIIEAARQSTQGSFRGWEDSPCSNCGYPVRNSQYHDCCPDGESHTRNRGDAKLLKYLYDHKHSTPFEFAGMVIEVQAPIFVFREWHRHRTQSYNELSARYEPLPDLNYIPTAERLLLAAESNSKQAGSVKGAVPLNHVTAENYRFQLSQMYDKQQKLYLEALEAGVPKELARIHLPVGRYSRMRASANLRNWLAFMTLRADPAAQWEIRQFAYEVANVIRVQFPKTFKLWDKELL